MKKFLILMPLLFGAVSQGALPSDVKYRLNRYMGSTAEQVQLGTLIDQGGSTITKDGYQGQQMLVLTYDFSVNGGSSAVDIDLGANVPDNAIITKSFLDVLTTPVGGASITITTEGTGDVLAAVTATTLSGRVAGVSTGTAANMKKMTQERAVLVQIDNANLTAGKFRVFLEYVMSE